MFIAALLMMSGFQYLIGGPRPGSVNEALPGPLVFVWAAVLVAGGLLVVVAALAPTQLSLYLELMAHPALAISCWVYAAAAVTFAGLAASLPAGVVLGAGAAAAVRAWQVIRTFKAIPTALEDKGDAD